MTWRWGSCLKLLAVTLFSHLSGVLYRRLPRKRKYDVNLKKVNVREREGKKLTLFFPSNLISLVSLFLFYFEYKFS